MKKIKRNIQCLALLISLMAFDSCKPTPNFKEERKKVVEIHDKVMIDNEKGVNDVMLLDSISKTKMPEMLAANPTLDTLAEKKQIAGLIKQLNEADDVMMDWMNKFEPDVEHKSNEEALKYFQQELVKIKELDDRYKKVLEKSGAYLKKSGMQIEPKGEGHEGHKH